MGKKLRVNKWVEIKTRYELHESVRRIAADYKIPHTTILLRAKKENWTKNRIGERMDVIKDELTKITTHSDPEQIEYIEDYLSNLVKDQLQIARSIYNLDKGILNLNGLILKKTIDKVKADKINELDASAVSHKLSGSSAGVATRAGIGKEKDKKQDQQKSAPVTINIIGQE